MGAKEVQLVLISGAPLLAALLGYALLWLRPALAQRVNAWLGITGLIVSAGAGFGLLQQVLGGNAVGFSIPWLHLPDAASSLATQGKQGALDIPLALLLNLPALLFVLSTALIGLGILLYALRERRGDTQAGRFFANLTLFNAAMLLLLSADTLLLVYIAWEVMGLCSYLLIAHRGTPQALRAARQAFWTTRVTDFGLLIAIFMQVAYLKLNGIPTLLSSTTLSGINPATFYRQLADFNSAQHLDISSLPVQVWLGLSALLVLLAVIGKSGQWPLSFWLAGAMAAPTPVSAMLHAATMVAAGPYLLYRMSGLFFAADSEVFGGSQIAMLAACLVGALTLVLCGLMALCASDAKRALAYSTASQLGLAILGIGVLAEGPALWQLLAHAWCKAALFLAVGILAAGSASHSTTLAALRGMARNPLLKATLVLGALSLMGLPLLPGGVAKEGILQALWTRADAALPGGGTLGTAFPYAAAGWTSCGILLVLSLPITAAYLTRLVGLLAFAKPEQAGLLTSSAAVSAHGEPVAADFETAPGANSGWGLGQGIAFVMALVGCLGLIPLFNAVRGALPNSGMEWAWPESAAISTVVLIVSLVGIAAGAVLAWYYNVASPDQRALTLQARGLRRAVAYFRNGMLLRQFWQRVIGTAGWIFSRSAAVFDRQAVDALLARALPALGNGLARGSGWAEGTLVDGLRRWFCNLWWGLRGWHAKRLQNGSVQHYMLIVIISAVLLCLAVLKPLGETFREVLSRL